ncbi:hypothetical protein RFI_34256 [Reticulomyxa filosa]|uniref:Uncharacterized protein n=1 Tax=Reticulomyxa filosa TaxID=46433 RepID=X6LMH7_RETFI|nr:hypothetical protein RFI_34256 [Reticulomyxa filosa]|eukprot:ETO03153.1 hypothetical protein RFI_34256 [Reticulomyxa filosa]
MDPNICVVDTLQSQVFLFDLRSDKTALMQTIADDYDITCVKVKSKQRLLIGISNGFVFEFDYLMSIYERERMQRLIYRLSFIKEMFAFVGLGRYLTVIDSIDLISLAPTLFKTKVYIIVFFAQYCNTIKQWTG